jgi:L-arabinose isomerase
MWWMSSRLTLRSQAAGGAPVAAPSQSENRGCWICRRPHTSFSYAITAEQLRDFASMAGIEFLLIDENTRVEEFKEKLRWNDLYYHLAKGL